MKITPYRDTVAPSPRYPVESFRALRVVPRAERWALRNRRYRWILRYERVPHCPACGGPGAIVDHLNRKFYRFGPFDIRYPEGELVPLSRCNQCSLVYKVMVPDPADLRRLFADVASEVWASHRYDYWFERELVLRFANNPASLDVMEIGSSDGDLLAAFDGLPGRRAALDVVFSSECARRASSEYILQYLEDPLRWSQDPYDVVLAFDILEHLYRPPKALANLASLTRPGGILVIQTGNASSAKHRLRDWWYLNLLEHHMAWTTESLRLAASSAGFRLEISEPCRHKDVRYMPAWKRVGAGALRSLAGVPGAVPVSLALTSYDPRLVAELRSDDHFTAFLRREPVVALPRPA